MIRSERRQQKAFFESDVVLFGLVCLFLMAIYVPTSSRTLPNSIDPLTNSLTAYLIAETGSLVAHGYEPTLDAPGRQRSLWLVDTPQGPVTRYPPGTALVAVPIYWIANVELRPVVIYPNGLASAETVPYPEMWPAAVAASLTTAAAMGLLAVLMRDLGLSSQRAAVVAVVTGLSTSLWSVAANALWQHGPAALAIIGGLLLLARNRLELAGLSFAAGILIRPQIALVVAVIGIVLGFTGRSIVPMLRLGLTSAIGALAYLIYNVLLFGRPLPDLSGGYAVRAANTSLGSRLSALGDTMFDIHRGLFIHSPILLVALVAIPSFVRRAQPWMVGATVGGLIYLIFQARPGDFAGGWGFWSYRYPLEGLVFAAPLLGLAATEWVRGSRIRRVALVFASVASIMLHAYGTILIEL